jgi:hypothetical protein
MVSHHLIDRDPNSTRRAFSVMRAIRRLGFTVLFSDEKPGLQYELYQRWKERVPILLVDDPAHCITHGYCLKTAENPDGIPRWKRESDREVHRCRADDL